MNLRDLNYVVALAEQRHFGRAAEVSHVSQPTLSMQVKKLERELGVALFERSSGGVRLTRAGEAVAARARVVLRGVDEIREIGRRERDPEAGVLSLGVLPTSGPYLLPHVLGPLRDRFPRLELRLVEDRTDSLLARLHRGRLDAAVVALPVDAGGLHTHVLFDEPFVLATPPRHRLSGRVGLSVGDLRGEELLLLEEGHCLRDQALDVCRLSGALENSEFRATSLETLRHMVAVGGGVTLLPVLAAHPRVDAAPAVSLTAFCGDVPRRTMAMVWRRSTVRGVLLDATADVMARLPSGLLDPLQVTSSRS